MDFLDIVQGGERQFPPGPAGKFLLDDIGASLEEAEGFALDFGHGEANDFSSGIHGRHLGPGQEIHLEAVGEVQHILDALSDFLHPLPIAQGVFLVDFHQVFGVFREGVGRSFATGSQDVLLSQNQWFPLGIKDLQGDGRGTGGGLHGIHPSPLGWVRKISRIHLCHFGLGGVRPGTPGRADRGGDMGGRSWGRGGCVVIRREHRSIAVFCWGGWGRREFILGGRGPEEPQEEDDDGKEDNNGHGNLQK